jgi:hypothetical protein
MSRSLVEALTTVADRLAEGAVYQWGHMGQCNCGQLAQVVTKRTAADIHQSAISRATGEWSEHAFDYCHGSGALIDDVVDDLLAIGLNRDDIVHLENLSDARVLARVGRPLERHVREDAIAYFRAFAALVSSSMPVPLPTQDSVSLASAA